MLDFIEMRKQLQKALASDKLFVRISYLDEGETIQHYYLTHNFPREDIMLSIEHIAKEILPESLETEPDEEDNT
jgi:hypothetical protein